VLSHIVIAATALVVSGLTLFSGFGLGTILMPVFALFSPNRRHLGDGGRPSCQQSGKARPSGATSRLRRRVAFRSSSSFGGRGRCRVARAAR
jgi:hypothetical protein